tara:strand:- start:177 stop:338 length:162 start_codon:yes stop_codon:yes gene_type:complete
MAKIILYSKKKSNSYTQMENINEVQDRNQARINNIIIHKLDKITQILEGFIGK